MMPIRSFEKSDMTQVILLMTKWSPDYWQRTQEAPYEWHVIATGVPNLNRLVNSTPMPGLGIYGSGQDYEHGDRNFVYIEIKGISSGYKPYKGVFYTAPFKRASHSSDLLRSKLPDKHLVASIESDSLLSILSELGENPPVDWLDLLKNGL